MKSFNIIRVSNPDSTNNHLRKLHRSDNLPEGTVILADYQTNGRGTGVNSWYSGNGLNILISILLYPGIKADRFFFLTEIASLAIIDLLKELDIHSTIKWPNDIYSDEKKIAGILIENILTSDRIETSIIGIGLNVNENDFPDNLPNPVSIKNLTGKDFNRDNLVKRLIMLLIERYNSLLSGDFKRIHYEYNAWLFRKNLHSKFLFRDRQFIASIRSVQENGIIILETDQYELKQFTFGELDMIV